VHHGDLDAHVAQSSDALCPVSFDRGSPFELQAELGEKRDSGIEGLHHDADVVHPLKRHAADSSPVVASTRPPDERTGSRLRRRHDGFVVRSSPDDVRQRSGMTPERNKSAG
jgi:hypothetical protein